MVFESIIFFFKSIMGCLVMAKLSFYQPAPSHPQDNSDIASVTTPKHLVVFDMVWYGLVGFICM